jgi:transcriptional regulator with XRE-family HTH domain
MQSLRACQSKLPFLKISQWDDALRSGGCNLVLSQQALGDALGISYQRMQKYGVSRIGAGRLQKIGGILRVPVSFFFDEQIDVSRDADAIFTLLNTPYSLRLIQAFARMPDRLTQQRTVEMVEQIAIRIEAVRSLHL